MTDSFFRGGLAMLALVSGLLCDASSLVQAQGGPTRDAAEPGFLGLVGDDEQGGRGVRVAKVDRDSPAEQGMLKEGDLIHKINDQPIRGGADMRRIMARFPAGTKITFHVSRDGSAKDREVTLGDRPARDRRTHEFGLIEEPLPPPPEIAIGPRGDPPVGDEPGHFIPDPVAPGRAVLGLRTVPPTELDRLQHGAPNRQGAMIVGIAGGSPAHLAEVPLAAIVVAIDGKMISGPTDLARRIATFEPGDEIELSYYYKGEVVRRRTVLADEMSPPVSVFRPLDSQPSPQPRIETPPAGQGAAIPPPTADRVADLERQVKELERRLADLEGLLKEPKAAP